MAAVLSCHAHHQGFHLRLDPGPAWALTVLGAIELLGDESDTKPGSCRVWRRGLPLGALCVPDASRSQPGWHARDHSTAISRAASPSEYGSPWPDIHSAAKAPGSPCRSRMPAVAPTSWSYCRLLILLWSRAVSVFWLYRRVCGRHSRHMCVQRGYVLKLRTPPLQIPDCREKILGESSGVASCHPSTRRPSGPNAHQLLIFVPEKYSTRSPPQSMCGPPGQHDLIAEQAGQDPRGQARQQVHQSHDRVVRIQSEHQLDRHGRHL